MIAKCCTKSWTRLFLHLLVSRCAFGLTFLSELLKKGDVALIKGSHDLRMDRIVSALEADS